jgi:hypothetical protein
MNIIYIVCWKLCFRKPMLNSARVTVRVCLRQMSTVNEDSERRKRSTMMTTLLATTEASYSP